MPYAGTPWVRNGELVIENAQQILVDSPAWFEWLRTASSFCYCSTRSADRFSARKEKRHQQFYCMPISKMTGSYTTVYLGKSARLTSDYLEAVCRKPVDKACTNGNNSTSNHGHF